MIQYIKYYQNELPQLKTCPPMHTFQIKRGGSIPEEYYCSKNLEVKENMLKATINEGGTLQLEFEITTPNCAIRYMFSNYFSSDSAHPCNYMGGD